MNSALTMKHAMPPNARCSWRRWILQCWGWQISYLQRGMELSPHDSRLSVWGGVLATALRVSGNLSEAIIQARYVCERDDRTYMPRVVLAGVYTASAEPVNARAALQDALRIKPDLTDKQVMYLVGRRLADGLMQS